MDRIGAEEEEEFTAEDGEGAEESIYEENRNKRADYRGSMGDGFDFIGEDVEQFCGG